LPIAKNETGDLLKRLIFAIYHGTIFPGSAASVEAVRGQHRKAGSAPDADCSDH
jgi:hypothetical protein